MSGHTPGPWHIQDDHGRRWIENNGNDDTIAEIHRRRDKGSVYSCKEALANSHLIAAAPDLLSEHQEWSIRFGAALMAVMQEDYGPITDLAMSMPFDFHESGSPTVRSAAIAKAKGQ